MKINSSLGSYFQKITHVRHGGPERILVHPMREWMTCLMSATVIACVLFGFSGFDFYTQYNVIDTPIVLDTPVPKYREVDAQSIIKFYKGKEIQFEGLRGNRIVVSKTTVPEVMNASTSAPTEVAEDSGGE